MQWTVYLYWPRIGARFRFRGRSLRTLLHKLSRLDSLNETPAQNLRIYRRNQHGHYYRVSVHRLRAY